MEFQDLCNGKCKVILKRVYEKTFNNSATCMTLNRTMCYLFTFEVIIVDDDDDDAVFGDKDKNNDERYYGCACPENIVVGENRRLLWDVMDEWLEQTETLNVTLNVVKNENKEKRRLHPFKIIKKNGVRTELLSCVVCIYL